MAEAIPLPNAQVTERMALFATTNSGRAIIFTNEEFDNEDSTSIVHIYARLEGSVYSITKRITLTVEWTNDMLDIIGADMQRMMNLADEAEQIGSLGPLGENTSGEKSIGAGSCSGISLVDGVGASTFRGIGSCSGTSVVSGVEGPAFTEDTSIAWISTVLLLLYPFLRGRISMGTGSASGSATVTGVSE